MLFRYLSEIGTKTLPGATHGSYTICGDHAHVVKRERYETVAGQIGHTTIDSLASSYFIHQVLSISDVFDKEVTRRPIDFD